MHPLEVRNRLVELLPPPAKPFGRPRPEDWAAAKASLKCRLPKDYVWFLETYGLGSIDERLFVCGPVRYRRINSLQGELGSVERSFELAGHLLRAPTMREQFPSLTVSPAAQYELFPSKSGLLPWGVFDSGYWACWQTAKKPEKWKVLILTSATGTVEPFEGSMIQFLSQWVTGDLRSEVIPQLRSSPRFFTAESDS